MFVAYTIMAVVHMIGASLSERHSSKEHGVIDHTQKLRQKLYIHVRMCNINLLE